jgi:hypothetical protein
MSLGFVDWEDAAWHERSEGFDAGVVSGLFDVDAFGKGVISEGLLKA